MRGKYKKLSFFILGIIGFLILLSACSSQQASQQQSQEPTQQPTQQPSNPSSSKESGKTSANVNEKMLIYTSIYPLYDFARQIGGEYVVVKSLVPWGAEAHDFEPSARNVAKVNEANLFIYNGAGFEVWIDKLTQNLDPSKTKVLEATKDVPMLGENVDPTVWLDPTRAKRLAENILNAMVEVDPSHQKAYQTNYEKLAEELDALDKAYEQAATKAGRKEFVAAHAAFGYLADRYGLEQIPVAGLSPDEEPTQRELQNLIDYIKEKKIKYVAFEELVESKVVKTLQRETGTEAVTLSPLENITSEQFQSGKTFIDLMYENLETLKKVLEVQ